MIEEYISKFFACGSPHDALESVKQCRRQGLYSIGIVLCEYFINVFPRFTELLSEMAICFCGNNELDRCYDTYQKLLSHSNMEKEMVSVYLHNQNCCIDKIKDRYIDYNEKIVEKIMKKTTNKIHPLITLTITTCKRYDLFETTMNSFLNCCTDIEKIDEWFCVDDNSSEEDRKKMKEKYPFFRFYFKDLKEKGHPQSMNIIRREVKTPFIFHMEDDWKFFSKKPFITECLDVLSDNPQIGQCLINKNYAETSKDIDIVGGIFKQTHFGQRYYIHDHVKNKGEQEEFDRKYGKSPQLCLLATFFIPSLSVTEENYRRSWGI